MPNDNPNIVKETIELTVAATGYTVQSATIGVLSEKFGQRGKILSVQSRLDATLDKATAGVLYITDTETGDIDANTLDSDKVYESASVVMAGGSAVTAELIEATEAPYTLGVDEQLKVAMNVTAAAGGGASSKLYVTVRAEVYG